MIRKILVLKSTSKRPVSSMTAQAVRSLIVATLLTAVGASAGAAQQQQPEQAPARERPQKGVGFQSSWPAFGFSGIYDVNERLSGQAVVGFFGSWTTLSARGLARFGQRSRIDPYGYGMVGLWRFSGVDAASTVSFGGGAGVDIDLRLLAPELPPLFWNVELGLSVVSNVVDTYDGAFMSFGAGLHYRF